MAGKKICIIPAEGSALGVSLTKALMQLWSGGHQVFVLTNPGTPDWSEFSRNCGTKALQTNFNPREVYNCDLATAASESIYRRLKGESFELIIFPARGPAAFRSLQAARVLGDFSGCVLALAGDHCPETDGGWPDDPLATAKLAWVERYGRTHCDLYLDTAEGGPEARPDWWRTLPERLLPPVRATGPGRPLVSVCVPYYNHEKYLFQLYDSLRLNFYDNYEVVLVDDGSDKPEAREALEKLHRLGDRRWRIFSTENQGPGAARNMAAELAAGDYLIFMDSDNYAFPHMLETFVRAMGTSGADCLTCLFPAFAGDDAPGENTPALYRAAPYGACLEAGLLENVFGDTNFIIKRETFQALGGFDEKTGVIWEDYEFLARLCLKGYSLEVVPEELFWYRVVGGGRNTSTSVVPAHRRIAALYAAHLPEKLGWLPENIVLPLYYQEKKFRDRLNRLVLRFLPLGGRSYRLTRSIWLTLKKYLKK